MGPAMAGAAWAREAANGLEEEELASEARTEGNTLFMVEIMLSVFILGGIAEEGVEVEPAEVLVVDDVVVGRSGRVVEDDDVDAADDDGEDVLVREEELSR